jgi:outer membrane protein assembly factor BamD (BamD/ComL family)
VAAAPVLPSSTLGYENDLYARALAARKAGDRERALATFQELERRFPGSLLREPSLVERMRLAAGAEPAEAAALAREYLTRFPQGTARGEAAALLAASRGRSGAVPPP